MSGLFVLAVLMATFSGLWAYQEPGVFSIGLTVIAAGMAGVVVYVAGRVP